MPSVWVAGIEGAVLTDAVDSDAVFNRSGNGTPYDAVVSPGHCFGKSELVEFDSDATCFYASSVGHYLSEFNNVDPEAKYRVVYPIGRSIRGRVWSVTAVLGAFSHREVLDRDQEASLVVGYVQTTLTARAVGPVVAAYECRMPIDRGPGATYMAKAQAFELLPEAHDPPADPFEGYPIFNADSICDGLGTIDRTLPPEDRIFGAWVFVDMVGGPDLADVERRILGIEVKYDRL